MSNYNSPSFSSALLDSISRSIDSPPIPPISDLNNHTKHTKRIKMRSASASSSVRNRTLTFDVDSCIQTHHAQPHQQIRIVRQQSVPTRSQYQPSDRDRRDTTTTTCSFSSKIRINSPRFFAKTKSRAIELYGDFKTIKSKSKSPPVSPCKRIASFINSIFRNSGGGSTRKSKPPPSETSTSTSTSSSSVSKTASWLEKSSTTSTETQRLATILHRKSPMNSDQTKEKRSKKEIEDELMMMMMIIESNCDDDHKQDRAVSSSDNGDSDQMMNNDDDEDDDGGESCASSDLFELENLRFIGVSRYCEELPLYGTTSLHDITA